MMNQSNVATAPNENKLDRKLDFFSSFSIVTGTMIGSAIFLVASDISRSLPTPWHALSVWAVAGVISLMGGLLFAELGTLYPKAGGIYVYLSEAFHPLLGFLYGWALFWIIQTGSIAAVAVAFARFSSQLMPMSPFENQCLASLMVVSLTIMNCFGVKKAAVFLDFLTSIKILTLIAFVGFVLYVVGVHHELQGPVSGSAGFSGMTFGKAYGVALIAAFWAYDGWIGLSQVAGEVQRPQKNIPLAMAAGVAIVTLIYLAVNGMYYLVLSPDQMAKSDFVASSVAKSVGNPVFVKVIVLLVALSALGCLNAMILSGARVIYAMSDEGVFFSTFAKVHPRHHTPNAALILQMLWTLALVWSGSYDQLFTYVIFATFIFYGLGAWALFRLRREDGPFKVPAYPYLPLFYIVFISLFTINALFEKPLESLLGLGFIAIGIPVYFILRRFSLGRVLETQRELQRSQDKTESASADDAPHGLKREPARNIEAFSEKETEAKP